MDKLAANYKALAAGVINRAYQDYASDFRDVKRYRKKLEAEGITPTSRAQITRNMRIKLNDLAQIEMFFESDWYQDVIEPLAYLTETTRFKEFKRQVEEGNTHVYGNSNHPGNDNRDQDCDEFFEDDRG